MYPFITPEPHPWDLPASITQFWCRFDPGNYQNTLYPAFGIPFPDSLNKAVDKRRAEFLAGRVCAHNALATLGYEGKPVAIGAQGSPLWPDGVAGSISHTRTWACAIACVDPTLRGVGVDIENIVNDDTLEQSLDLILVNEERSLLKLGSHDARTLFTLLFSLKESFFKAAYPTVGHYFDFDAVSVTGVNAQAHTITFRLNTRLHDQLLQDAEFQAHYCFPEEDVVATLVMLPRCL